MLSVLFQKNSYWSFSTFTISTNNLQILKQIFIAYLPSLFSDVLTCTSHGRWATASRYLIYRRETEADFVTTLTWSSHHDTLHWLYHLYPYNNHSRHVNSVRYLDSNMQGASIFSIEIQILVNFVHSFQLTTLIKRRKFIN